jgi:hypothetical protein
MRARALREAAASDACAARGAAATREPASVDIVARARGFKRSKLSTRRAFGCARATPVSSQKYFYRVATEPVGETRNVES